MWKLEIKNEMRLGMSNRKEHHCDRMRYYNSELYYSNQHEHWRYVETFNDPIKNIRYK